MLLVFATSPAAGLSVTLRHSCVTNMATVPTSHHTCLGCTRTLPYSGSPLGLYCSAGGEPGPLGAGREGVCGVCMSLCVCPRPGTAGFPSGVASREWALGPASQRGGGGTLWWRRSHPRNTFGGWMALTLGSTGPGAVSDGKVTTADGGNHSACN